MESPSAPAPLVYTIRRRTLHLILIGIVVAAAVLATIALVVLNPAIQPYAASFELNHYQTWSSYQGKLPLHDYFLVAAVTVRNTGSVALPLASSDWGVSDEAGSFRDLADPGFYEAQTLGPGQTANLTLVFDTGTQGPLAKIALVLPNGFDDVVELSSAPEYYSAAVSVQGVQDVSSYGGINNTVGYYMLVNTTITNTGSFYMTPTSGAWFLTNLLLGHQGDIDSRLYTTFAINPGDVAHPRLVFQVSAYRPTYLAFQLPNGTLVLAPLGPIPTPYNGTLSVTGSYVTPTYQGQYATSSDFLVVNVTLKNTGPVTMYPYSWQLVTSQGTFTYPDSRFYAQPVVAPAQTVPIILVYDGVTPGCAVQRLNLYFPDGSVIASP